MATGNINIQLNSTKRNQQATIKVKESRDFMKVMDKLTDICFNNTDKMEDGLYLEIQNTLLELYNLSLMSDIQIQSKKKLKENNKGRYTMEEKREAFKNGNPHLTMCNNCSRIICKSFIKDHLASNVCKDNAILIGAIDAQQVVGDNLNDKMLCGYVGGAPQST